jgi:hypothetical protein
MTDRAMPQFPLYVVTKGRADSRLTIKALISMGVPFHAVVEAQEYDSYAAVIDPKSILILNTAFQRDYDTCDQLGDSKSKGPGAARNFAWYDSIERGYAWHWVMDDNIRAFYRLHNNLKYVCRTGVPFRAMEDFCLRYMNIGMAGPCYEMFAPRKKAFPPFITNTRIYSCNLIRNDLPFRWRGRYNEDTILSLDLLKARWCTVEFYAFLQEKRVTQRYAGGNTTEFYQHEGTAPKSRMLVEQHPDVARLTTKWGRPHHYVNYAPFRATPLVLRPGVTIPEGHDDYGLVLEERRHG